MAKNSFGHFLDKISPRKKLKLPRNLLDLHNSFDSVKFHTCPQPEKYSEALFGQDSLTQKIKARA